MMGKPAKTAALEKKIGDASDPEDDVEMTFFEHLGELRNRLVKALWGLIPGVAIAWAFKERILDLLTRPLVQAWRQLGLGDPQLHFANPIDPFVAYMKIAFVCGLIFGSPWLFWQLWQFIAPGLYRSEKRLALPFVLASTIFFAGGSFFGYLVVFPAAFETFLGFAGMLPDSELRIQPTLMMSEYLDFSVRMLLAFGITFEVPVVITFLSFAGIVNWKQLLGFARWWIVISAVIAALLTPPDVGSQLMMLVPLVLLYFVSIFLAWVFGPKPPPAVVETAATGDDDEVE
ncbi:Twin-arginine translocation protein TatC [Sandaracinus amylolyticus]|uniref:Sec-independent protein translocase protein TatC n=2 Tax=Sandaracinus amylolyticus TaxID=927083 RepID=A0A0F6WAU7_9BACT|nr:Twin-arginine translocation protein TatC [Sandaracinus amylolyticus]